MRAACHSRRPSSQRVEYRIAAADINPYIALAAAIGSGLWGIEHRIEPDAPDDGQRLRPEHPVVIGVCPRTLYEAADTSVASSRALSVRRCLRRTARGDPPVGGARISQGDHRLGIGALFRDHLKFTYDRRAQDHQPGRRASLRRAIAGDTRRYRAALERRERAQRAWSAVSLAARCDTLGACGGCFRCQCGRHRERDHLADGSPIGHAPGEVRGFEERAR